MRKVALITGGAKGIGREITLTLANKGYDIIFTYNSSFSQAKELESKIANLGNFCIAYKCDLTKQNDITNLFLSIYKQIKHIDVLVNNAGISLNKLLIDTTYEEINNIITTNLTSLIEVTKKVTEDMISEQSGCIINISSIWGECGASMETVYSASKAGVIGFTKGLAKELALSNIRVNAIAPGAIETDMLKEFTQQEKKELADEIPLGKIGNTNDVAKAVSFLVDADYVTGHILSVNGGLYI